MCNSCIKPNYSKMNSTLEQTMSKALHTDSVATPEKIVKNIKGGK